MSIVLPVLAVLALAGFSVAAAVLTTLVAEHPERAAMVVVLGAAGAGAAVVVLELVGLAVVGVERAMDVSSMRRAGTVDHDPVRLVLGLGGAGGLLGLTAWLVATGDWRRVDQGEEADRDAT